MRCKCGSPARVVVDFTPQRESGSYKEYCWPCYHHTMKAIGAPTIVNYIDKDDKDDSLKWDAKREAPTQEYAF